MTECGVSSSFEPRTPTEKVSVVLGKSEAVENRETKVFSERNRVCVCN